MAELGRFLVLLSILVATTSMEKSSMYVKNSDKEDMETSASGYDYHVHLGVPYTYKIYKTDMSGKLNNFAYPPITYGNYKYPHLPLHEIPLSPTFVPEHYDNLVNSYGIPISYAAYAQPIKGYDEFLDTFKTGYKDSSGYGLGGGNFAKGGGSSYGDIEKTSYKGSSGYGLGGDNFAKGGGLSYGDIEKTSYKGSSGYGLGGDNFAKGGGSSYGDVEKASHGENGARGYSTFQEFEKGLKGANDNNQHKGFFKAFGGQNGGFHDLAGHYGSNRQASKGERGESFSDKKDNKKGSKTTGYHKIYLKDDYKKDHSFYDKADKNGYFRRYGDYNAKKDAQEGGFKKGGNHDSGFHGVAAGVKGFSDKGKIDDEVKGYKGAAGSEKYYQNNGEYASKSGKDFGKVQGYTEDGKV